MKVWRTFRQDIFEHVLRLDGSGGAAGKTCMRCNLSSSVAQFRCNDGDCIGFGVVCSECICTQHRYSPLHWIEVSIFIHGIHSVINFSCSNGQAAISNMYR